MVLGGVNMGQLCHQQGPPGSPPGWFHKPSLPVEALIPLVGFEILHPTREHGQTICWFLLTNRFHNLHLVEKSPEDWEVHFCSMKSQSQIWTSWWSQSIWHFSQVGTIMQGTVLEKLDRNESHAHKFGCKYQHGSREYHVCSKMSFETPPFVPCHSPNNSIFVLLPNAQFLVNLWRIPKFRWILLINKNPASQPISQKITSQFTSIYNINLWCVFKSKPDRLAMLPSQELTYPFSNSLLKMIFLFPRWGVLVPRGVC